MNLQKSEMKVVPLAKTPSRLAKLVINDLSKRIASEALGRIANCFRGYLNNLDVLIVLKNWYWEDNRQWLGMPNASLRYLFSSSFMSILESWNYPRKTPLISLCFQLAFCCNTTPMDDFFLLDGTREYAVCMEFLNNAGPFYISALHDAFLFFNDPLPLKTLLLRSSLLRHVHVSYSIVALTFCTLALFENQLEVVVIDIDVKVSPVVEVERDFYHTFFGGKKKIELEKPDIYRYGVNVTFPDLKKFCIRYDRCPHGMAEFLLYMQRYYPDIQIQVTNMMFPPFVTGQQLPFLTPTLLMESKGFELVNVEVFLSKEQKVCWGDKGHSINSSYRSVASLVNVFTDSVRRVQGTMSFEGISDITFFYCDSFRVLIGKSINCCMSSLLELYISLPCCKMGEEKLLVETLNSCPKLKVLGLLFETGFNPKLKGLKTMENLECLSVNYVRSTEYGNGDPAGEENITNALTSLVEASPHLWMLEMPAGPCLTLLVNSGILSAIHTLSLRRSLSLERVDFQAEVKHLPQLKIVVFNMDILFEDYDALKKSLSKSDLEVAYKKDWVVTPPTRL